MEVDLTPVLPTDTEINATTVNATLLLGGNV